MIKGRTLPGLAVGTGAVANAPLLLPQSQGEHKAQKTNIIFILPHDQGVWAAGCYGIRTPNIDRLTATGVRFEQ